MPKGSCPNNEAGFLFALSILGSPFLLCSKLPVASNFQEFLLATVFSGIISKWFSLLPSSLYGSCLFNFAWKLNRYNQNIQITFFLFFPIQIVKRVYYTTWQIEINTVKRTVGANSAEYGIRTLKKWYAIAWRRDSQL